MTLRALAGAVAFAAALWITGGQAYAGDAWAPPVLLYPNSHVHAVGASIAPDGTVTTAVQPPSVGLSPSQIQVRTKPPGGVFGPPQTLTTNAESGARMVSDADGNVAVIWTEKIAGVRALRGTTRPAGGSFSPVRAISDAGSDSDRWDVAVAGGKVLVSWMQNQRLRVATATAGSAFEVPDPLTGPIGTPRPDAALASNGAAVIVWGVPVLNSGGTRLQAMARQPGGAFAKLSDVALIPHSSYGGEYHLSISDEGRATAAWTHHDATSDRWVLQSASRGKTGDFGGIETVDTTEHHGYGSIGLETSPDGTSLLMWSDGLSEKLRYAIRPEGSGFGPTLTVTNGVVRSLAPVIVFGGDDVAFAVWHSLYQGRSSVQTARIRMDGTSMPAEYIGMPSLQAGIITDFGNVALDADAAGNATLAWSRSTDTDPGVDYTPVSVHEVRVFDTTPPAITGVSVPASALTGVPVPMAVTATDSLTPVTVRWKISKFVTLQGPSIAPSYASPGPNGVSIEVTDAVGHQTFTSRTFQINQNPVPPPPPCPEGQICQ